LRPGFYRFIAEILRFNREVPRMLSESRDETTVSSFLDEHHFSADFRDNYLLPMGAAIWSCPVGTFADFPMRFIAEFYQNHGLLNVWNRPQWRVVEGGSRSYVEALI